MIARERLKGGRIPLLHCAIHTSYGQNQKNDKNNQKYNLLTQLKASKKSNNCKYERFSSEKILNIIFRFNLNSFNSFKLAK